MQFLLRLLFSWLGNKSNGRENIRVDCLCHSMWFTFPYMRCMGPSMRMLTCVCQINVYPFNLRLCFAQNCVLFLRLQIICTQQHILKHIISNNKNRWIFVIVPISSTKKKTEKKKNENICLKSANQFSFENILNAFKQCHGTNGKTNFANAKLPQFEQFSEYAKITLHTMIKRI